jgi:hypothetical protein
MLPTHQCRRVSIERGSRSVWHRTTSLSGPEGHHERYGEGPTPRQLAPHGRGQGHRPCADSFALEEFGCVLLSALRDWARDSPTTAVPGIVRSIIRFTVIPDPYHADTTDILAAMRDEKSSLRVGTAGQARDPRSPLQASTLSVCSAPMSRGKTARGWACLLR